MTTVTTLATCLVRNMFSVGDISADVTRVVDFLKEGEVKSGDCFEHLASLLISIDIARTKAHEQLEAATIAASALRHKLGTFHKSLQIELKGAIDASEPSAVYLRSHQERIVSDVNGAAAEIENRKTALEHHNDKLMSDLKSEGRKYRQLIEVVNTLMTGRSEVKIVLNSTRDQLQTLLDQIKRCDKDTEDLAEENMDAHNIFEVDLSQLHSTLEEIKKMISSSNMKSKTLTSECDISEEEVSRTTSPKMAAQQLLSDYVLRVNHALDFKKQLRASAERDSGQTQVLIKTSAQMKASSQAVRSHYHNEEKHLIEQQQMILKGVEDIKMKVQALAAEQGNIQIALQKETESKNKHHFSLSSIQRSSISSKKNLQFHSEESSRLQTQNEEFHVHFMQSAETHQVTCTRYKEQILSLQHSLKTEESFRRNSEAKMTELKSITSSLESDLATYTTHLSATVKWSYFMRETVREKLSVLKSSIEESEEDKVSLNDALLLDNTNLQMSTEKMDIHRQQLEEQVAVLHANLMDMQSAVEALEPRCSSLEDRQFYVQTMYGAEKENVICMKSTKTQLTDTLKQFQDQLKNVTKVQNMLRMDVIQQRAYTRKQMRCQLSCIVKCESEITKEKQDFEAVVHANLCIFEVTETLKQLCSLMEEWFCRGKHTKPNSLREVLKVQWEEDNKMEIGHCEGIQKRISLLSLQTERRKLIYFSNS